MPTAYPGVSSNLKGQLCATCSDIAGLAGGRFGKNEHGKSRQLRSPFHFKLTAAAWHDGKYIYECYKGLLTISEAAWLRVPWDVFQSTGWNLNMSSENKILGDDPARAAPWIAPCLLATITVVRTRTTVTYYSTSMMLRMSTTAVRVRQYEDRVCNPLLSLTRSKDTGMNRFFAPASPVPTVGPMEHPRGNMSVPHESSSWSPSRPAAVTETVTETVTGTVGVTMEVT